MPVIVGEHSAYTRVSRRNKIILSKRESNDADRTQSIFETRGRTQRSAPTQRLCRKPHIQDETTSHRDARWNVEWVGR